LPLEWVYEKPEMLSLSVHEEEAQIPYVAPSSEQALVLFKLIMTGNIKKIIENVKKLAKNFEMSKLKKLITDN